MAYLLFHHLLSLVDDLMICLSEILVQFPFLALEISLLLF